MANPTTPGWKTTEFWLSLAAAVLGALFASGVLGDGVALKVAGAIASVLGALGYTVSRGAVKKAAATSAGNVAVAALNAGQDPAKAVAVLKPPGAPTA